MSSWVHDGNRVYNAAAPVAWTSLDLKAIAGGGATSHPTAKTLALLKVENSAGSPYIAFRPDSSVDTYVAFTSGHGCVMITPDSATSDAALVLVPTASDGTIEWKAQTASATEIWLVGFVQATAVELTVSVPAALPSVWTALDLTQDYLAVATGITRKALAYLWFARTGGASNDWATRPENPGDSGFLGVLAQQGGCSQGGHNSVLHVEGIVQKTNVSGEIEIIGAAPVSNELIQLASFVEDGFANADVEVVAAAVPPTAWTALDLSGYIGAQRSLVLLQVHMENFGPGLQGVSFRAAGDASDYLPGILTRSMGVACCSLDADERTLVLVETSAAGQLEWISSSILRDVDVRLLGVLPTTPSTPSGSQQSPEGVVLSSDTPISFEVEDDFGLDMTTLVITATPAASTPITIYTGGAWQTGWGGMISEQGLLLGSDPTKIAVTITDFSDAFLALAPRRCTMSAAITNILGEVL